MWRHAATAVAIAAWLSVGQAASAAGTDLETINPEAAGWSSAKLADAARYAGEIGYTAIVMACDGRVFFTWGEVAKNYRCHSLRKPLLSALYGLHVAAGTINLDRTLADLDIHDLPPDLTPQESGATVRQLLQGRSGVYHEAAAEAPSMIDSRPPRGSHAPGTFYNYNNWDFNVAGTVFRELTGTDIFAEFATRIARPIGMQDFDPTNCAYEYERE